MEDNLTNELPQGIWYIINENGQTMARKTLEESSKIKTITVPLTKEILETIKKQIEANKIFNAFKQVDTKDEYIIGYLNLILNDYINYLDKSNLNQLITKMKSLTATSYFDSQNSTYITKIVNSLEFNNIDSFYDTLEEFQSYNSTYFIEMINKQELNAKTH